MRGLSRAAFAVLPLTITLPLLTPEGAAAQCTRRSEARAVENSLQQAVQCNDLILRFGPDIECAQSPLPACAGTLLEDAVALARGAFVPPVPVADREALLPQLRCERRISTAVLDYLMQQLPALIRGEDPDAADGAAR
jgi:hypothetical protein